MARRILTAKGKQVRIEGLAELQAKIGEIMSRTTGQEAKRVFMKGAIILRDRARELAPVKTGRLRSAIFAAYGKPTSQDVLVGVSYRIAPHAHLVEYGTKWAAPHPYMRPAVSQARTAVVQTIASGFREIIADGAA